MLVADPMHELSHRESLSGPRALRPSEG
eukprot:SAG31_NODE_7028_length_1812_cov_2.719206_1_plen_27_part_10